LSTDERFLLMKNIFLFLFFSFAMAIGQEVPARKIKSETLYINNKLVSYTEKDPNGNEIFNINNGMNGDITMIYAADFDSQNREIRNWSAHSNIGFASLEKVYEGNVMQYFDFVGDSVLVENVDRDMLNAIRTREAFLKMPAIQHLSAAKKKLFSADVFDPNKNVIEEFYFSGKGDTTSTHHRRYNAKNQEVLFSMRTPGDSIWNYDVHSVYDDRGNLAMIYRTHLGRTVSDTTEVTRYEYNDKNQLVSETYAYEKTQINKTVYVYKNGRISEQLFYEEGDQVKVRTRISYDKQGVVTKRNVNDYRYDNGNRKERYRREYTYW